ncbi:MarR family winged helix-turn-helix transcriptional regulator [Macrococcus brunensis]|uniref:MarR family winged helix-turn-helix transcriptional regulator n=1 Tax=Macrococcus brunensis TaxID=198483 RepID=UPI001EEFEA65|nr:MarR family transcriptional regulator [Macrococcus brunensis]ULG70902.1 MarR family transcriptional regulator [Macrococcus brunensis]ULG73237.1 MarR family transcriptional regulator [Macrococcus brunensis]
MSDGLLAIRNLQKLQSEWTTLSRKILKSYDITYPQFRVLNGMHELQASGKRMTQSMVSEHTGIDVMTLSTIIRNLENRRLIRRQESRSDTRAKNVYLTTIGLSFIEEMEPIIEQAADSFFEEFSSDLKNQFCQLY